MNIEVFGLLFLPFGRFGSLRLLGTGRRRSVQHALKHIVKLHPPHIDCL